MRKTARSHILHLISKTIMFCIISPAIAFASLPALGMALYNFGIIFSNQYLTAYGSGFLKLFFNLLSAM